MQPFAEAGRGQQPAVPGAVGREKVLHLRRVDRVPGEDLGGVEGVGHQPVHVGPLAGDQRRGVDPRLGGKHGAAAGKDTVLIGEAAQVRHQPGRHHVRPQPVEHDDQNLVVAHDTPAITIP